MLPVFFLCLRGCPRLLIPPEQEGIINTEKGGTCPAYRLDLAHLESEVAEAGAQRPGAGGAGYCIQELESF